METHRKQIRLLHYDYGNTGAYYITICTHNRKNIFSKIQGEDVILSHYGHIVEEELERTSSMRDNLDLGDYVIMPNHLHFILLFHDRLSIRLPDQENKALRTFGGSHGGSLSSIVGNFKSSVTSRIKKINNGKDIKIWQRGFYDHIIRDEKDLFRIIDYIRMNPINWSIDEENLERINRR